MAKSKDDGPRYLAVGHIRGAHGIRGEVKVELLTDYPERFKPGATMYLGSEERARPVEITAARPHQGYLLVKLSTVPDRSAAQAIVGQLLLILEEQAMPLGEHENYAHDLLGLAVTTVEGRPLGVLTDILATGANDVYVVTGPEGKGEVLIPALRDVVVSVDLEAARMVVALPEGLLEEPANAQEEPEE